MLPYPNQNYNRNPTEKLTISSVMYQCSALLPHPFDSSALSVADKPQGNLSQPYTHICSSKKTVKPLAFMDQQSSFQMPGLNKKVPGQAMVF